VPWSSSELLARLVYSMPHCSSFLTPKNSYVLPHTFTPSQSWSTHFPIFFGFDIKYLLNHIRVSTVLKKKLHLQILTDLRVLSLLSPSGIRKSAFWNASCLYVGYVPFASALTAGRILFHIRYLRACLSQVGVQFQKWGPFTGAPEIKILQFSSTLI
jgi:hypothetical protein